MLKLIDLKKNVYDLTETYPDLVYGHDFNNFSAKVFPFADREK